MDASAGKALLFAVAGECGIRVYGEHRSVVLTRLLPLLLALEGARLAAMRFDTVTLHGESQTLACIHDVRRARLECLGALERPARSLEITILERHQSHRHGGTKVTFTYSRGDAVVRSARQLRMRVQSERGAVRLHRGIELIARLILRAGAHQGNDLFEHPGPLHALLRARIVRLDGERHFEAVARPGTLAVGERRITCCQGVGEPLSHRGAQPFELRNGPLVVTRRVRVTLQLQRGIPCRQTVPGCVVFLPAPDRDTFGLELRLGPENDSKQPFSLTLLACSAFRIRRRGRRR